MWWWGWWGWWWDKLEYRFCWDDVGGWVLLDYRFCWCDVGKWFLLNHVENVVGWSNGGDVGGVEFQLWYS